MAKSVLRIRFVIGHQDPLGIDVTTAAGRQRFGQGFAGLLVRDFAFSYAEDNFRTMARTIETQVQRDIRRELTHLVALFRRHIIGAKTGKPAGKLDILSDPGYASMAISTAVPSWAARSPLYLQYKGNNRWWDHTGRLSSAMTTDNWISAFGPILVNFRRSKKSNPVINVFGGTHGPAREGQNPVRLKIEVGTLSVSALTNITPEMLPGLATDRPETIIPTSRTNDPLMLMVQTGMGDDIAYRLGRLSAESSGRQYRPTLEPFLTFFLTRSVPAAVAKRLETGRLQNRRSRNY